MRSQKDAVILAVKTIFEKFKIKFEVGMDASEKIEGTMRAEIIAHVVNQFSNGEATLKTTYDESGLKTYCNGLVSNWLRKGKELNGGKQYKPKNPGSRAGQGSPEVRELRKLLKQVPEDKRAQVQTALDSKIAAHKATKSKSVEINKEFIPEELRNLC